MDISQQEIEQIVRRVLTGMETKPQAAPAAGTPRAPQDAPSSAACTDGVFENVDDAVEAA